MQRCESTAVLFENPEEAGFKRCDHTFDTELHSMSESEPESDSPPLTDVLGFVNRRTLQFSTLCEIEHKWENSLKKIDLTHAIESYRDAVMIPVEKNIVIFHMQNGGISQAQNLSFDTFAVEYIPLPNDVICAKLALFCLLNDEIYCFPRTEQHFFHK